MDFQDELTEARQAAQAAGAVILAIGAKLEARTSAPADVSTEADLASQDTILRRLAKSFPGDAFRAEEKTATLETLPSTGRRLWIIDPIDGTRGFVLKNGQYSVMIGLVVDGELVLGVVAEPATQREVYAVRGGGCWRRDGNDPPRRVQVSNASVLAESTLIQSHTKPGQPVSREVAAIAPRTIIETYSAGIKLARVADGTADLYVCDYTTLNDWDLAAGHILVEEARGRVSNLAGAEIAYGDVSPVHLGGVLATNAALHQAAIFALPREVP